MASQDTPSARTPDTAPEPLQPALGAAWDAASPIGAGPAAAAGIAPAAQARAIQALQDSPPMLAQRKRLRAAFGPEHVPDAPAQRERGAVAQRAEGEPIKSSEVADGEDGEYVLIELNPGAALPRAADVADMLDRDGLARERGKDKERDAEPLELDAFEDAVLDALAHAPRGNSRGGEVRLRGLKNGRVEVVPASGETPGQVIVGPYPPGALEDRAEYSEADLLFSDSAAASGDHSAITDSAAGSGPSLWGTR